MAKRTFSLSFALVALALACASPVDAPKDGVLSGRETRSDIQTRVGNTTPRCESESADELVCSWVVAKGSPASPSCLHSPLANRTG